jgi:hypothetical protein
MDDRPVRFSGRVARSSVREKRRYRSALVGNVAVGGIAWLLVAGADAQTDEIQVYDADINSSGQFSLQLHNNYTPIGRNLPDFKGGIVPNHTLNGVPEWAYGVTDWLELGAYVPVYSWTGSRRLLIDGAKLRAEFVVPHAQERSFFYGVNFELSFNARYWEPTRNSGEIRPIIGGRIGPVDLIVNPILDTSFQGLGSPFRAGVAGSLQFFRNLGGSARVVRRLWPAEPDRAAQATAPDALRGDRLQVG